MEYPEKLSLVLEPEAASFYCRAMKEQDIAEYAIPQNEIPKSGKYIVVDVGGGTADLSAHGLTYEGNIKILTPPEGSLSGGNSVNQEFMHFLTRLVYDPGFSTYVSTPDNETNAQHKLDIRTIVYNEFEEEKVKFGKTYVSIDNTDMKLNQDKFAYVKLSESFYDFYKQHLKEGVTRMNDRRICLGGRRMLHIQFSKMEEFFRRAVSKIENVLIKMLDDLNNDVSTIYLVGGFGGCRYMYYRVQELLKSRYGPNRFTVIIPKAAYLAVVEGAIQYRKNPELIRSRVAEATYGTETLMPFDQKIHDVRYYHKTKSGEKLCKHLFSPLVIEGECINYNQVKRNLYYPADPLQKSVQFNLLISDKKDLEYTRSRNNVLKEGVKILGTITVPSPNTDEGIYRDVYLTFDFSHSEIQVRAYDESSKIERRAVIDFLISETCTENVMQY